MLPAGSLLAPCGAGTSTPSVPRRIHDADHHRAGQTVAAPSCRHLVARVPCRGRSSATPGTSSTSRYSGHSAAPPDGARSTTGPRVGGLVRDYGRIASPRSPTGPRRPGHSLVTWKHSLGAGEGIRTPDPLITNQLLYRTELRQPDQSDILAQLVPQRQQARPVAGSRLLPAPTHARIAHRGITWRASPPHGDRAHRGITWRASPPHGVGAPLHRGRRRRRQRR